MARFPRASTGTALGQRGSVVAIQCCLLAPSWPPLLSQASVAHSETANALLLGQQLPHRTCQDMRRREDASRVQEGTPPHCFLFLTLESSDSCIHLSEAMLAFMLLVV